MLARSGMYKGLGSLECPGISTQQCGSHLPLKPHTMLGWSLYGTNNPFNSLFPPQKQPA